MANSQTFWHLKYYLKASDAMEATLKCILPILNIVILNLWLVEHTVSD